MKQNDVIINEKGTEVFFIFVVALILSAFLAGIILLFFLKYKRIPFSLNNFYGAIFIYFGLAIAASIVMIIGSYAGGFLTGREVDESITRNAIAFSMQTYFGLIIAHAIDRGKVDFLKNQSLRIAAIFSFSSLNHLFYYILSEVYKLYNYGNFNDMLIGMLTGPIDALYLLIWMLIAGLESPSYIIPNILSFFKANANNQFAFEPYFASIVLLLAIVTFISKKLEQKSGGK